MTSNTESNNNSTFEKIFPPVPVEDVTPQPEKLQDSNGHVRALVNSSKLKYVEIDGFGYYPPTEYYYNIDGGIRGFEIPENVYGSGYDDHCFYWKINPVKYNSVGPFWALLKFQESTEFNRQHVLNGDYDQVIELPTPEGILFFSDKLEDVIVAEKTLAERIKENGLLSVRNYLPTVIQNPDLCIPETE